MIKDYIQNRDSLKLIACDLDGTLIGPDGEIGDLSVQMLKKLQEDGLIVTIASGRMYHNCQKYIDHIGIKHFVVSTDGGYIRNPVDGEVMTPFFIESKDSIKFYEIITKVSNNFFIITLDDSILSSKEADVEFIKFFGNQIKQIEFKKDNFENILKIVVIDDHELILALKEDLKKLNIENIRFDVGPTVLNPDQSVLIVRYSEVDKGKGIDRICDYYGVHPDEVLVFGDWLNDIPMFRRFKHNVAPLDCDELLKPHANYISPYNNETDFVGRTLEMIFQ